MDEGTYGQSGSQKKHSHAIREAAKKRSFFLVARPLRGGGQVI